MNKHCKIYACIPAFNEARTISDVIHKLKQISDKVIVCDDGSSDGTSMISKQAGAMVIRHDKNQGKGTALKSLFNYIKTTDADIVITIDGDGQFIPDESIKLIENMKMNNSDIVIGHRFENKSIPAYRLAGNKFLDRITNMAAKLPFSDTQSGFRSYSKNAIEKINFHSSGFAADAEILIDASEKGLKITEEKVSVLYETGGRTSTQNPMSHFSSVVSSILEIIVIRHPLILLGIPGLIMVLVGITIGVNILVIFNETRIFSIPQTFVGLGLLIIGIMLILVSAVLFSINRILKQR